jgi:hypothetical protein
LPLDSAELEPASANHNLLLSNIQKVEGEWWVYLIKASDEMYKPLLSWLILFSGIWHRIVSSGVSFPVFQRIVLPPSSGPTAVVKKSSVIWDIMLCSIIVGECILLRMYQISKYRQPSFATVLQRALLYMYITIWFG